MGLDEGNLLTTSNLYVAIQDTDNMAKNKKGPNFALI